MAELPKAKPQATCLFTGAATQPADQAGLIGRFSTEPTHTHVAMLSAGDNDRLVSAHTTGETFAHMHGVSPAGIDLMDVTGIKVHAATTTNGAPVGLTFATSCPTSGEFKPIETLTRATFQDLTHGGTDAGSLSHHIAMPSSVGFVQPPSEIKFSHTMVPDAVAANMAMRRFRWHDMPNKPAAGYNTVAHETLGTLHAVPIATGSSMSRCNVSHLITSNVERLSEIAGSDSKIVTTSTGAKFAMIPDAKLNQIDEQLTSSFKTTSALQGGIRITAYPLAGDVMDPGATTTVCYELMKGNQTVAEKCAAAMGGAAEARPSHIESITTDHIGAYLGEAAHGAAAITPAGTQTTAQLTSELTDLAHGK